MPETTSEESCKKDYYAILQVHPQANATVIAASYRALVNTYNPDLAGITTPSIEELQEAYEVLYDDRRRSAWDRSREPTIGSRIGSFILKDFIAEGGMGKTYRGQHATTGLPVCIKILSRVSVARVQVFMNEARIMWDLRHFSIPAMRDIVTCDDGRIALVMSFIPGLTLTQIVERVGPLTIRQMIWILDRIINAFHYLHSCTVVHGDVKPQNIILQHQDRSAVLVDFGLSMMKPTAHDKAKGWTDRFAPPEQIDGLPLLPQSDFYSLALTVLYCLSGGDLRAVDRRQIPSDTPAPLKDFFRQMLYRDPLERPTWEKGDLLDEFRAIRAKIYGKEHFGLDPILGLD